MLVLNLKLAIMSKGKKKKSQSKKEEEQAHKIVKVLFVTLIVLGLIMLIGISVLN
ncbi:putative membrane protein [Bacteroides reticulotermitis]|uniref:Membrane protein n=1 Tax=Bacteroides reticulotermitis TaxID=1133319 RepID=A0A840D2E2_9BACE|nr:putative membrane protein [Bacteroides reticulotermitis]